MKTYLKETSYIIGILVVLTNFSMQATRTIIDFWLRSQATPGSTSFSLLDDYFGSFKSTFTFLIILNLSITFFRALFYVIAASLGAYRMYRKLIDAIIFAKMKFFDMNPSGRIIARLGKDTNIIDDELPWYIHTMLQDVSLTVALPIAISIQFPWMILFTVFAIYLIYKLQILYRPTNREIKRIC